MSFAIEEQGVKILIIFDSINIYEDYTSYELRYNVHTSGIYLSE